MNMGVKVNIHRMMRNHPNENPMFEKKGMVVNNPF